MNRKEKKDAIGKVKTEKELDYDSLSQTQKDATLGIMIEEFIKSDIGNYLIQRANQLSEQGIRDLVNADPENPKQIREAHNKIRCAEYFEQWLMEGVNIGRSALDELQNGQK